MSLTNPPSSLSYLFSSTVIFLFLTCYFAPGLSGGFWLDDYSNLPSLFKGLEENGFIYAVLSGNSGPTGRPLSLLSFLAQAGSWPEAKDFIIVNIFIHALNSVLVFFLSLQLLRLGPFKLANAQVIWASLLVSVFWSAAPIQISSVLYVVQRMTLLSSFFVLISLHVFILGRSSLAKGKKKAAYFLLCFLLPLLGVMGLLAKETAFLLIVYLLLVDRYLAKSEIVENGFYRRLFAPALLLVFFGFVVYLLSFIFRPEQFHFREFDLGQRLLTEVRVLWQYLAQLVAPRISSLGLYHDSYVVSENLFNPLSTIFSVIAWLLVVLIASHERHVHVLFLAVFWYLGGHLLESATLPLELYFEHRNYLPSFGVWFGFVVLLFYGASKLQGGKLKAILFSGVMLYLMLLLVQGRYVISQWGSPDKLAFHYSKERPGSIRAREMILYVYQRHNAKEQIKLELESMLRDFPGYLALKFIGLEYACLYPDIIKIQWDPSILLLASEPSKKMGSLKAIDGLYNRLMLSPSCSSVSLSQLEQTLSIMLENKSLAHSSDGGRVLLAEMRQALGRSTDAQSDLDKVAGDTYEVAVKKIQLLAAQGRYREAIADLNALKSNTRFSTKVIAQSKYLRRLENQLNEDLSLLKNSSQ